MAGCHHRTRDDKPDFWGRREGLDQRRRCRSAEARRLSIRFKKCETPALVKIVKVPGALGIQARPTEDSLAASFLGDYLTSDLQNNDIRARAVLAHVDAALTGEADKWSESGNAYLLTVTPTGATLDFHWADDGEPDEAALSLEDLRDGLLVWLTAISEPAATN